VNIRSVRNVRSKSTKPVSWWMAAAWFLLSGTTPGAVGSCGEDETSRPADFASYCQQHDELICTRRFLRKEITAEARDSCRWDAVDACERRAFPSGCAPTQREADACLRALASFDTLSTPDTDLEECQRKALCKATPSEQPDAGVGSGIAGAGL
jgi:hypothetical protein